MISPSYGGVGGTVATWVVPPNEQIQKVNVSHSGQINSLAFITDKNTRSPVYGRFAGAHEVLEIPAGYHVIGICGRSGAEVDAICFIIGKTIIPSSEGETTSAGSGHSEEEEEIKVLRLSLST